MRITSFDRLGFRDDLFDTREGSRLCYLCVPLFVRDDYDVDTQSGNNMTEGNGLGEVAAQWRVYAVRTHFRNVDLMLMTYGHVPPGVEIGDALVNFGPRDLPTFRQAMPVDDSYLLIDEDAFHIISLLPNGMGQNEEWCADCRKFNPIHRADGY